MYASMGFPKKLSLDYWWWEVLLLNHPQISTSSSLSPNSWLKIDAPSPRPKTPILWLDVSIALPVRVLPFGIGTFTPPIPPFWRCVDLGVCLPLSMRLSKGYSLPIRSNRISWKLFKFIPNDSVFCVPYLLGQIGLVGNRSLCYPHKRRNILLTY